VLASILSSLLVSLAVAQQPPPDPIERLEVAGRPAFLMMPKLEAAPVMVPWVWYAPTLPGLPSAAEKWMFDQFLAAGVAIAGIDVGESYGSAKGRLAFTALHKHLTEERGLSPRPCLLARSRGGLMLYNWAAEHAALVAGIAGIYPVCNLRSYPGLAKACGAYGMTEEELSGSLRDHNPIERLASLAAAQVPIYHIHGDQDGLVPLADNSHEVKQRYGLLGGQMTLAVAEGQGHNMWPGFFQCQPLVDFVIAQARTTRGVIEPGDASVPKGAVQWIAAKSSLLVPEKADVACQWQFADGVLTASPSWDSVVTAASYRDFRMHIEFNVNESHDDNPEANGNSGVYIQQRYELQILDSFGVSAKDYKNSYCGSLYRLKKPDQLVCRQAGEWQSFDIVFRGAVFQGDRKAHSARITAYQNGKLIHDDVAIARKTGAGQPEAGDAKPIKLQGHHNQVRFRNFWVVGS
jgi:pimeloyl-ACP methyl ester carboxylesterase